MPLFYLFFAGLIAFGSAQQQVQLVQIVHRHGDRAPTNPFPNDEYQDTWQEGIGQLTNIGKNQAFQLGQWIRTRYSTLLSPIYKSGQIYSQSSETERCIMSATALLAGLFPPTDWQIWNPDLLWQPVPVHTNPVDSDFMFEPSRNCRLYDEDVVATMGSDEVRNISDSYSDLYQVLTRHTGEFVRTLAEAQNIYDTLFCNQQHGYSLPLWAEANFQDLEDINNLEFELLTNTDEMKRLAAGVLINAFVTSIESKVNGESPDSQLLLYSGHDTNVAAFLDALGVYDGVAPPYASAVVVELSQDSSTQNFFVQAFYRNDNTATEPVELFFPFCADSPCALDEFINGTAPLAVSDPTSDCRLI